MNQHCELPEPQTIPLEYSGQWLAWSADGLRIIAHALTLPACQQNAQESGEQDPYFQKAPAADVRIIGAAR